MSSYGSLPKPWEKSRFTLIRKLWNITHGMPLFVTKKCSFLCNNKNGHSFEIVIFLIFFFYNWFKYLLCKSRGNLSGQPTLLKIYINYEEIQCWFLGSGIFFPINFIFFRAGSGQSEPILVTPPGRRVSSGQPHPLGIRHLWGQGGVSVRLGHPSTCGGQDRAPWRESASGRADHGPLMFSACSFGMKNRRL